MLIPSLWQHNWCKEIIVTPADAHLKQVLNLQTFILVHYDAACFWLWLVLILSCCSLWSLQTGNSFTTKQWRSNGTVPWKIFAFRTCSSWVSWSVEEGWQQLLKPHQFDKWLSSSFFETLECEKLCNICVEDTQGYKTHFKHLYKSKREQ